jgi:endonuclease YncB( thermonuclease family)
LVARHFRRELLILSVSTVDFFISSFSVLLAVDFTGLSSPSSTATHSKSCATTTPTHPLSGIDCPEKGQAFGQKAKQAASDLAFGKEVTLQTNGYDKYKRTLG